MTQNQMQLSNPATVRTMLQKSEGEIVKALSGALDPVQFSRICMTTYQLGGERMQEADPRSFVAAIIEAAQLGLTPVNVLGECYIIPRWNRDTRSMWAYFQLGYRGAMKLARRGGEVNDIQPELVYANDHFHESKGTDRGIEHVPWYCNGKDEPGELILGYCTAERRDGKVSFRTITRAEIDKAARRSGDPRNDQLSNVWRDHFEAMALKTTVHRLVKFLPIPDQAKQAIIRDEYREAGVRDAELNALVDKLGDAPEVMTHIDMDRALAEAATDEGKARLKREKLYGAVWHAAGRFFHASQIELDRYHGGKAKFETFIAWAADEPGDPENDIDRVAQLTQAKLMLKEWSESHEEDARQTCDAFREFMEKRENEAAKQADDDAFEAAQGGAN